MCHIYWKWSAWSAHDIFKFMLSFFFAAYTFNEKMYVKKSDWFIVRCEYLAYWIEIIFMIQINNNKKSLYCIWSPVCVCFFVWGGRYDTARVRALMILCWSPSSERMRTKSDAEKRRCAAEHFKCYIRVHYIESTNKN